MLAVLEDLEGRYYRIDDYHYGLSLDEIKFFNDLINEQNKKEDYPIEFLKFHSTRVEAIYRVVEFLPKNNLQWLAVSNRLSSLVD